MSKILRCNAPGCRTLTGDGFCDKHRAPEPKIAAAPVAPSRPRFDAELFLAQTRVKWGALAATRRAEQREEFAALKDGAEKAMRRFERPVFSGEC